MLKRGILFLSIIACHASYAMFVTLSINYHEVKNLKEFKIEVVSDADKNPILLKAEDGLLFLPSFDVNKIKTIHLIVYYKGKEYQTAEISYPWVTVTGNSCSVNIITTRKAKKKYNLSRMGPPIDPPEMKLNWVMVTLCCNEGMRFFNKPF